MKIALIADTHAGDRNDSTQFNEYFIRFFTNTFFPYIKEHNIKNVIHLGDVFDRRKYINLSTLNSWNENVFSPMNEFCERVDILLGNHDTYYKNTNKVNSVSQTIAKYENFNIYDAATEVAWDKCKMLYIPWICDENEEDALLKLNTTDAKICVGHLEIIGFEMHSGQINNDLGFNKSTFDRFFATYSGHFHHKSKSNSIEYLGTPYEMIWSDYNDVRGFHVFDTETYELEFIRNQEQIFCKLVYDDSNANDAFDIDEDFSSAKNKIVRVIVDKKTNPYLFDRYMEKLASVGPHDVSVVDASVMDSLEDSDDDLTTKDTLEILLDYVTNIETPVDKNTVASEIQKLYIEAINLNDKMISK